MSSLVADYGESSNSNDSDCCINDNNDKNSESTVDSDVEYTGELKQSPPKSKLPPPDLNKHVDTNASVFTNHYVEEENQKRAILEKHVKMVDSIDHSRTINGKKVCWNYRKGRCRFGNKCKYAHDSELQISNNKNSDLSGGKNNKNTKIDPSTGGSSVGEINELRNNVRKSGQISQKSILFGEKTKTVEECDTDDGDLKARKKRKRPGLSQGIVPGKKVMKQYFKNEQK